MASKMKWDGKELDPLYAMVSNHWKDIVSLRTCKRHACNSEVI